MLLATNSNCWCQLLVKLCASLQLQGTSAPWWELLVYVNGREWLFTVELGVLVPYPDEGKDAKDHRRPSALQRKQMSLKGPVLSIHVVQKIQIILSLIFYSLKKDCHTEIPVVNWLWDKTLKYFQTLRVSVSLLLKRCHSAADPWLVQGAFLGDESTEEPFIVLLYASIAQWQAGRHIW